MQALPHVHAALERAGSGFTTTITDRPGDASRVAADAVAAGVGTILGVGGDGLVGELVGDLAGTTTRLGLVPAGTGNDFARAMGYEHASRSMDLAWLSNPASRAIDLAVLTNAEGQRYVANVLGAGFDAAVNETANALTVGLSGSARYVAAVGVTLRRFTAIPFAVEVDGDLFEQEAMLVAVANSTSYGGGMKIAPDAQVDDGLLDVCIVHAMTRREFVWNFPRVFMGRHVTDPRVTMVRGKVIAIEGSEGQIYADGEPAGHLPARIVVAPGALQLVSPGV